MKAFPELVVITVMIDLSKNSYVTDMTIIFGDVHFRVIFLVQVALILEVYNITSNDCVYLTLCRTKLIINCDKNLKNVSSKNSFFFFLGIVAHLL